MKTRISIPRLIAITLLSIAAAAQAATITVMNTSDGPAPGPVGSLRRAISDALPGDTINFAAGITTVTLTSGELLINKNLIISGPGANLLSVQGTADPTLQGFRIFTITSNGKVTISGLTIANGIFGAGGGVYIDSTGTLTVANCTISGNTALESFAGFGGGGIYNNGGTVTITNSTVSGNRATSNHGGGIYNKGTMNITNSTISTNTASSNNGARGGGIYCDNGTVTITNSTISGNTASGGLGGGIYNNSSTLKARNTIVALNNPTSSSDVSGVLTSQGFNLIGNNKNATITPTTGDQIGTAGSPINPMLGQLLDNGGPTFTHALLSGSTAIERGHSSGFNTDQRGFARPVVSPITQNPVGDGSDIGAYEVQADLLPGCNTINRIVNNNNDSGTDSLRAVIANVCIGSTITFAPNVRGAINLTSGELLINKSLTISGPGARVLTISGNNASRIFNTNFPNNNVAISGLTIANGSAPGANGGAIYNAATLTISYSTISGNSASSSSGGGIYNTGGTLTITNSTISGNMTGNGGGIYNVNNTDTMTSGTLTITNSTISGNAATSGGGGIVNAGTSTITNSTISGNSAGSNGGGIFNGGGTVSAKNTIVALNSSASGPDVFGALTSQNFNLIGNSSGATIAPAQLSDQIGVTAAQLNLRQLLDNGGPTQTHALLSGSFAIDKGNSSGSNTDQRGAPRPVDDPNSPNGSGNASDIGAFEVQVTPPVVLANISGRLPVGTGDNALFAGFIVTGYQPKKVILRAIGPSLGIAGGLADPTLELRDSTGALLQSNDNWKDSPNKQAIIDSTIPPPNDLESAIVATLPATSSGSSYTAIIRGVGNATGIGVVEVYDLDRSLDSKLANISNRGFVQTGDNALFAGNIVVGQASQKVIIRALGPSVPVPGAMADPTLELHDANGALLEANDNWVDSPNKQAIIDSTIPPKNDLESAIVRTLTPANYTAIVRGVNNSTGIAVVEVYALQ